MWQAPERLTTMPLRALRREPVRQLTLMRRQIRQLTPMWWRVRIDILCN
jgi:hypothetical protein